MVFYGYTPHFSLLLKNSCCLFSSALFAFAAASFISRALSPRRPRAADTVYILHYRHRYPVHGTGYASLFLNPCASVYTQLGQSCSAATRLSLHIPPEQVVVDAAQQKLVKTFVQIWVSCVLLHMSYLLDFLT